LFQKPESRALFWTVLYSECETLSMYLMYVDESGDSGLLRSPTNHFALSSLVVHESRWREFVNQLIAFRLTYGLPLKTEIHAAEYIRQSPVPGMKPHVRLAILRNFLDELAKMDYIFRL
jgi:hypothetical protein